jgi:hypothetical protein
VLIGVLASLQNTFPLHSFEDVGEYVYDVAWYGPPFSLSPYRRVFSQSAHS